MLVLVLLLAQPLRCSLRSVNGAGAATVDTNGYLLARWLAVTVAVAKLAATGTITNVNEITAWPSGEDCW
jgi:hypothetical protein